MPHNLMLFVIAAMFEIAGCFAFWYWLRKGGSAGWAMVGIASLVAFALALARVDTAFAGRAYAAYAGVYIGMAVLWLWLSEGQRPTPTDLIGAAMAITGTLIILSPLWRR